LFLQAEKFVNAYSPKLVPPETNFKQPGGFEFLQGGSHRPRSTARERCKPFLRDTNLPRSAIRAGKENDPSREPRPAFDGREPGGCERIENREPVSLPGFRLPIGGLPVAPGLAGGFGLRCRWGQ
jgi:hypothetical protein